MDRVIIDLEIMHEYTSEYSNCFDSLTTVGESLILKLETLASSGSLEGDAAKNMHDFIKNLEIPLIRAVLKAGEHLKIQHTNLIANINDEIDSSVETRIDTDDLKKIQFDLGKIYDSILESAADISTKCNYLNVNYEDYLFEEPKIKTAKDKADKLIGQCHGKSGKTNGDMGKLLKKIFAFDNDNTDELSEFNEVYDTTKCVINDTSFTEVDVHLDAMFGFKRTGEEVMNLLAQNLEYAINGSDAVKKRIEELKEQCENGTKLDELLQKDLSEWSKLDKAAVAVLWGKTFEEITEINKLINESYPDDSDYEKNKKTLEAERKKLIETIQKLSDSLFKLEDNGSPGNHDYHIVGDIDKIKALMEQFSISDAQVLAIIAQIMKTDIPLKSTWFNLTQDELKTLDSPKVNTDIVDIKINIDNDGNITFVVVPYPETSSVSDSTKTIEISGTTRDKTDIDSFIRSLLKPGDKDIEVALSDLEDYLKAKVPSDVFLDTATSELISNLFVKESGKFVAGVAFSVAFSALGAYDEYKKLSRESQKKLVQYLLSKALERSKRLDAEMTVTVIGDYEDFDISSKCTKESQNLVNDINRVIRESKKMDKEELGLLAGTRDKVMKKYNKSGKEFTYQELMTMSDEEFKFIWNYYNNISEL